MVQDFFLVTKIFVSAAKNDVGFDFIALHYIKQHFGGVFKTDKYQRSFAPFFQIAGQLQQLIDFGVVELVLSRQGDNFVEVVFLKISWTARL